jgi:hypothetical protein
MGAVTAAVRVKSEVTAPPTCDLPTLTCTTLGNANGNGSNNCQLNPTVPCNIPKGAGGSTVGSGQGNKQNQPQQPKAPPSQSCDSILQDYSRTYDTMLAHD